MTEGLSGTLRDGGYTEDMMVVGATLVGAGERKGTYSVTVRAPGYLGWAVSGVVVTADECHVIPVALEAALQPA